MFFQVLDKKEYGKEKGCILCAASLDGYLTNLGDDFDKYDIQRSIVGNPYLDDIATTVFSRKHIPVITLVIDEKVEYVSDAEIKIEKGKFRILDGLQRTWRLKTLRDFISWLKEKYPSIKELNDGFCSVPSRSISLDNRKEIIELGMTDLKRANDIAGKIVEMGSYESATDSFVQNKQWFEVWYGLEQDEIIKEMLLLNAGHKSMSGKHQIELLYLNWLDLFSKAPGVKILRDKNIKSSVRFVQEREVKQYRFSDLVMATLAFNNGRVNDIQSTIVMKSFETIEESVVPSNQEYYKNIITFIANVDECISNNYPEIGREWFGRANVMEAFCAAAGAWSKARGIEKDGSKGLEELNKDIKRNVMKMNLNAFDTAKNKLDVTKISVGQRMKKVVFQAIGEFLQSGEEINWDKHFSVQGE